MQRWDKEQFAKLGTKVTWWDHPDRERKDVLSPRTRVLVPPANAGSNYKPKKEDWQRIPWVREKK